MRTIFICSNLYNINEEAKNMKNYSIFKKEEVSQWICRKCGHIQIGKEAPCICPVCEHPQNYFQIFTEKF